MGHHPHSAQLNDGQRARPVRVPAQWRFIRDMLFVLISHFGEPSALAAQRILSPAHHKVLSSWLRGLEALVRRLLLIMASKDRTPLDPAPKRETQQREFSFMRRRDHGSSAFAQPNSAKWPVRFQVVPRVVSSAAKIRRAPQPLQFPKPEWSRGVHWARPLAERLEALSRVVENPTLHARKLRQRLLTQTSTNKQEVENACARFTRQPARLSPYLGEEVRRLKGAAQDAALMFRLSG